MLKVVADDKIPFLKGVLEPYAEVVYAPGAAIDAAMVKDADALFVRTRTKCDAALLAGSRVQLVVTATIGLDHIDGAALDRLGIAWSNAPGCNAASVAQYVAAVLTAPRTPLEGVTLGIVGVGEVGRRVAAVGEAFGMRVLLCDPPRARREGGETFTDLQTIAREAEVITFHTPLTCDGEDATFHLADAAFFAACRKKPLFINASRGEVVDEGALCEALRKGWLSAAAIDTWEHEPEIDRRTLDLVQWATPHVAGYSADGKANGTRQCVQLAAKHFHLPELTDWQHSSLPVPGDGVIQLDETAPLADQLFRAIHTAYSLARDDASLRQAPALFEELRGHYPLRRELFAYRITGGSAEAKKILQLLQKIR